MCGILFSNDLDVSVNSFSRSLKLMQHRGPDFSDVKTFESEKIKLGHARLSIIDLDNRSNQPFTIDKYHLIYNGEVYNYKELIREHNLETTTDSDTEVVLRMFIKYGSECLKFFNGMFAFVVYNDESGDLFAARDRLGIKPLYVYEKGDKLMFSSEVASILELYDSPFDEFGLRQYKKLRMTLKGYTIYQDIKMFPPGSYFVNGKYDKYWDLNIESKTAPSYEKLKFTLEDAIEKRKRADVPVGSYLSGGLDSTVLSFVAQPDHTWTVGFDDMNEFKWSELANKKLKSNHHQILVNKDQFVETGKWMIRKRKEPLFVPNEILIYLMTKRVKEFNTVILSGEGADELFWGYDRIFRWANKADKLSVSEFDKRYCYGSEKDDEVIKFALEGLPGKTTLDKVAYFFQKYHLHGLLRRLDNSTMLCSVEARVPFVDHRLVEMMAGTPFSWKMGNRVKEPLKDLYNDLIPSEIIERKKIGFPVPLERIFADQSDETNQLNDYDLWFNFNLKNLMKN